MTLTNKDAQAERSGLAERVVVWVLMVLLLILIGLGLTQIILRNIGSVSLPWADGAMRAIVLWLTMVASVLAAGRARHIRIDLAARWVGEPYREWMGRMALLVAALTCLFLAFVSVQMVALEYEFQALAFAHVPVWLVQSIVPLGFCAMGLLFAIQVFRAGADQSSAPSDRPSCARNSTGESS